MVFFGIDGGQCMRKIAVFLGLLGILFVSKAALSGVSVGVPFNADSICTVNIGEKNLTEFEVYCNLNAQNVTAKVTFDGIGMCASDEGPTALDSLTHHYGSDTWCWCKIYNPWVSKWIQAEVGYANETSCFANCASKCAELLTIQSSYSTFRNQILSTQNFVSF